MLITFLLAIHFGTALLLALLTNDTRIRKAITYDKGSYGEYLIFELLKKLDGYNIILKNLYIIKKDGSATEIDLLMVNETGIYVFESKNYSGWIFGDEKNKMWTQTLKTGNKYQFYNPVWQNRGHISALSEYLGKGYCGSIYSFVVFSERCELKRIKLTSNNVRVVKRNNLKRVLTQDMRVREAIFDSDDLNSIHEKLLPTISMPEEIKDRHKEVVRTINGGF